MARKQCNHCPWKVGTDPNEIPNGYRVEKHEALSCTIAEPGSIRSIGGPIKVMACHESPVGRERACVGWLANQLGEGNNIALRLAVATGRISADFELDGEQHATLEETLPRRQTGAKKRAQRR